MLQSGKPVTYFSRGLTDPETRFSQIEKECLVVCWALERLHYYVYACPTEVTVETDHLPLLAIHKKGLNHAPKRLQRMLLRLQRYNYSLVYRPGTALVLADTLSRAYQPISTMTKADASDVFFEELATCSDAEQMTSLKLLASAQTIAKLCSAAQSDDAYVMLIAQIQAGWPDNPARLPAELRQFATYSDELAVSGGLVFKGHRVVVPHLARKEMLSCLHTGANSCIERARQTVFFPGITAAIKTLIATCPVCSKFKDEQQKEPLKSYDVPSRPWEVVCSDIFSFYGQDYLSNVDYLSGFFEVHRLPSKKVKDVIYALKCDFARHGICDILVTDNSPYGAREFADFAKSWEFKHTMIKSKIQPS